MIDAFLNGAVGRLAVAAGVFVTLSSAAAADRAPLVLTGDNQKIAEFFVRDGRDVDIATVPAGKAYSELRICVGFSSVEFRQVRAAPLEPGAQEPDETPVRVRRIVRAGECTGPITLPGAADAPRRMRHIRLEYSAYARRGPQPLVAIYLR